MNKTFAKFKWIMLFGPAIFCFLLYPSGTETVRHLDFQMAERTLDWLDVVKSGAGPEEIKEHFMTRVAPTKGCQSIIHHWARFMKWDNETFFTFIMQALGKVKSDKPLRDEKGNLTMLGKRAEFWGNALENTAKLREEIRELKKINLEKKAVMLAKKFLPDDVVLNYQFYIVIFGASNAFSVGGENGFDLLQLEHRKNGAIDVQSVIELFAHEIHHTGISYYYDRISETMEHEDRLYLVALLAAEGMPTNFINETRKRVVDHTMSDSITHVGLKKDWEKHIKRMPVLFEEAEKDIEMNLEGKVTTRDLFKKWMSGTQGPAYAVGSEMFSVIHRGLGLASAKKVARDFRQFLVIYNEAARRLNKKNVPCHVFDDRLARRLTSAGE